MNVIFKDRKKKIWDMKEGGSDLKFELLNLLRKKFNFYTQLRAGQLKQTHLLKGIRREIAQIKFYLKNG